MRVASEAFQCAREQQSSGLLLARLAKSYARIVSPGIRREKSFPRRHKVAAYPFMRGLKRRPHNALAYLSNIVWHVRNFYDFEKTKRPCKIINAFGNSTFRGFRGGTPEEGVGRSLRELTEFTS